MRTRVGGKRRVRVRKSRPDPLPVIGFPPPYVDMNFDFEIDAWIVGGADPKGKA